MVDITLQIIFAGAGIIFIFFAIIGYIVFKISTTKEPQGHELGLPVVMEKFQLSKRTQNILALVGVIFLGIGIGINYFPYQDSNSTPTPIPTLISTPAPPTPTPATSPQSTLVLTASTATSTPSTSPFLSVSPDPIFFNAGIVNSGESVSQMFSISNTGDGTLIWSISDDQPWITVDPSSGTNSGTVAVNINTAGLSSGSYKGTITITSNGGNKNGTVSLNIPPTPTPIPPTPTPTPTPVSPTPTPTPTPIPLKIKIISPKEGDEVPITTIVNGTISGEIPNDRYMWLVVNPHTSPGQWWPQGGRIIPWNGQWNMQAQFGGENQTGQKFDIAIILVNEKDNQYYLDYMREGQNTKNFPGIPLPDSANMVDKITVTRK